MRYLLPFLLVAFTLSGQISESEIVISPQLKGTLFLPDAGSDKLVILIAGSGPTNRSGNQIGNHNNSLRFLSLALANKGFAVFSYDKRLFAQMISGSVDENSMRFEQTIDDAISVGRYFKQGKKFNKIVFAGHSEGSLVGMSATPALADGFISIAGPGRTIDLVLYDQLAVQFPGRTAATRKYLDLLKQGKTFEMNDVVLSMFFRESVQPYLISWIKFNPADIISKLDVPILIVTGTKDIQVYETEAHILKEAQPKASLAIIPDMNHVLKDIQGDEDQNKASYNDPKLPISTGLVDVMVEFLKTI